MGKIGDLWVKLGLKKDEYSKGMKEAGNEADGFLGRLKNLKTGATAIWVAIGAAVAKFAKDAISMTQKWGDQWNQTMAGIKGAYSAFVRQISSGEGWNNLFANMREAYRVSKEVAAALDEIFERKTSFSYQEADTERQIAQLQLIARDSSKSEAERIAANKKIIELTNQLGDAKKAIYTDEAAAQRKLFASQTHLNDEQIDFLVKEYNQNREVINQAREYLKQKKELSKVGGTGFFTESVSPIPSPVAKQQPVSPELEKLERETPQAIKDIAALTQAYDKANDALVKGMADAEVAVIRIDTETMHAQTRATAMLGTLTNAGGAVADAGAEQAQRILQRAQDSAKSEVQILNEKYFEEKALLEKFGLETTALTEEWSRNTNALIRQALDVDLDKVDLSGIEIEMPEIDDDEFQVNLEKLLDDMERAQEFAQEFKETLAAGIGDAVQELADQFMGLKDINPGSVISALLTPLADMAVKEGEILIAQGIGIEACKKALESLNGIAAIAAGTALVAIGSAAKAGLKSLAGGAARTTTSSVASSSSSFNNGVEDRTEITIYVRGKLDGGDIVLSGEKTINKWDR
jgi:hypothetical protein